MASRSSPGRKQQPAVAAHDLQIARAEGGALAAKMQRHAVEQVHRGHARRAAQDRRDRIAAAAGSRPADEGPAGFT